MRFPPVREETNEWEASRVLENHALSIVESSASNVFHPLPPSGGQVLPRASLHKAPAFLLDRKK